MRLQKIGFDPAENAPAKVFFALFVYRSPRVPTNGCAVAFRRAPAELPPSATPDVTSDSRVRGSGHQSTSPRYFGCHELSRVTVVVVVVEESKSAKTVMTRPKIRRPSRASSDYLRGEWSRIHPARSFPTPVEVVVVVPGNPLRPSSSSGS